MHLTSGRVHHASSRVGAHRLSCVSSCVNAGCVTKHQDECTHGASRIKLSAARVRLTSGWVHPRVRQNAQARVYTECITCPAGCTLGASQGIRVGALQPSCSTLQATVRASRIYHILYTASASCSRMGPPWVRHASWLLHMSGQLRTAGVSVAAYMWGTCGLGAPLGASLYMSARVHLCVGFTAQA